MAIRRFNRGAVLSFVVLLAMTTQADAQAQTLGGVITNVTHSIANFPFVLSAFAYLSGLFFAINGIFKFKDHVDNPHNNPLSAGVKRFLAGGMMLSGPYMYNTLVGSLFGGSTPQALTAGHAIAAPGSSSSGGGGMDQMIYALVKDFAGPMQSLLIAFTYIAAICLLLTGIHRLTKTAQEGPRGPAGMGTIMTFLASGALFSFGGMMGSFSSSLFGSSTVSNYATISSNVISDSASQASISSVIGSVMVFVMIVGYIAFIRGWFVLKAFADGNGNATLAQGLTFLFGGTLAINLGSLVNVLEKTVGVNGITFS